MNKVRMPKINPIRFYQLSREDTWTNSIPFWEYQTNYFQKFRETDVLCFQILTNGYPDLPINYKVYEVDSGELLYETDINQQIAGTPYKYGDWNVAQYNAQVLGAALWTESKLVQILLTVTFEEGPVYLKSDYLRVYITAATDTLIDNTVEIIAYHDLNEHEFIFTNDNSGRLFLRVEGGFPSDGFTPSGKFTVYQDQNYRSSILHAVNYNVERFILGSNFGVPNWLADKFNRLVSLDHFSINGVEYCRNEGSKLDPVAVDHYYPQKPWQIDLIRADNSEGEESEYLPGVTPFTADTTLVSADNEEITIDQEYI